ncbi:MAG: hypothetical protein KAI83_12525 [Thiomargarita sp.]|nr:hypothetical protein [Thiomargarita sp.]
MTALSAGAFAVSSFAAVNAYATNACLVCWAAGENTSWMCNLNPPTPTKDGTVLSASKQPTHEPVVWMSCYEQNFRNGFGAVTNTRCGEVPGNYTTYVPYSPNVNPVDPDDYIADNAFWFEGQSCQDLRDAGIIQDYVPLQATNVDLTATKNGSGADLTLTTSIDPNTATLLILRGEPRENGGTEIDVACEFPSGGGQYTCTDDPAADTYRAAEMEYDGSLIIYNEVNLQ